MTTTTTAMMGMILLLLLMMMFQLYTELPSGNLSPGSEICGCQEGGELKCTMLEEVVMIKMMINTYLILVTNGQRHQRRWRTFSS